MRSSRGDVSKLPKWAQAEIADLQRQLAQREERIVQLSAGDPDSNTFLEPYWPGPPRPVGKDTQVRFGALGFEGGSFDVQFDSTTGELEVVAQSGLMREPVILPQMSNSVRFGFRERKLG